LKNINILSLVQAHSSLKEESFNCYLQYYGIEIRSEELSDLSGLVEELYNLAVEINIFDGFYVGYQIPQIGKEFDLLRFGKDFVVNIELKKTSIEEKINKQLKRNKYYLEYIGKKLYNLCYV